MGLRDDSILTDLPTIPNTKAVTLNYYRNPQACKVYLVWPYSHKVQPLANSHSSTHEPKASHLHEHGSELDEVAMVWVLDLHHSPRVHTTPHLATFHLDDRVGPHNCKGDCILQTQHPMLNWQETFQQRSELASHRLKLLLHASQNLSLYQMIRSSVLSRSKSNHATFSVTVLLLITKCYITLHLRATDGTYLKVVACGRKWTPTLHRQPPLS